VLRRIFGPRKEEVASWQRKLYNERLLNLCTLPNVVKMIKSKRMRWVVLIAHMDEMENAYKILVRKLLRGL